MRQPAPMVFSFHLVYLSTAACFPEKLSWVHVGARIFKGQRSSKNHKMLLFVHSAINMQSLSGHYLMRQQVPMVFVLLLVYLGAVAYISVEIIFGLILA